MSHLSHLHLTPDNPPRIACFSNFSNCSIDDANDPSIKYLEMLEGSLVWEARSLCFIAVAAPAYFIYRLVGLVITGLAVLVVVMMVLPLVFHILHS
jgi:hypothetical protein